MTQDSRECLWLTVGAVAIYSAIADHSAPPPEVCPDCGEKLRVAPYGRHCLNEACKRFCVYPNATLIQWTPTPENINSLPAPVRRYIHDLETRCDPAGEVRDLALVRETIAGLEHLLTAPPPVCECGHAEDSHDPRTGRCLSCWASDALQRFCPRYRPAAPVQPDARAPAPNRHKDCGKETCGVPDDPDCGCRGTGQQAECASTGCGFCRAAESIAVRPAPVEPSAPSVWDVWKRAAAVWDERTTLAALRASAQAWEPDARLVGNVRAGDIVNACTAALAALRSEPRPQDEAFLRKCRELVDRGTDRAHAMLDEEHPGAIDDSTLMALLAWHLDKLLEAPTAAPIGSALTGREFHAAALSSEPRPAPTSEELREKLYEARKALQCLYIAIPDDVADDVEAKVEAVFTALFASVAAPQGYVPSREDAELVREHASGCSYSVDRTKLYDLADRMERAREAALRKEQSE